MMVLERAAQDFADAAARPPFPAQLPPERGRAAFVNLQSGNVPRPDVDVRDVDIVAGPRGHLPVRILRPRECLR